MFSSSGTYSIYSVIDMFYRCNEVVLGLCTLFGVSFFRCSCLSRICTRIQNVFRYHPPGTAGKSEYLMCDAPGYFSLTWNHSVRFVPAVCLLMTVWLFFYRKLTLWWVYRWASNLTTVAYLSTMSNWNNFHTALEGETYRAFVNAKISSYRVWPQLSWTMIRFGLLQMYLIRYLIPTILEMQKYALNRESYYCESVVYETRFKVGLCVTFDGAFKFCL